jgi:hypothetical protein
MTALRSSASGMAAATPLPSPHEAIGVVSIDLSSRVLTVRLSDLANGYTRHLWREAFQALRRSEEAGIHGQSPVWASTPDANRVVYAAAGDAGFGGMLKFTFRPGEASYTKLISRPGLAATVWIDRERHRFISCNFKTTVKARFTHSQQCRAVRRYRRGWAACCCAVLAACRVYHQRCSATVAAAVGGTPPSTSAA